MTTLLVLTGIVIIGTIQFLVYLHHKRHLQKIDLLIKNQAKEKGLKIKSIIYPTITEWKDDPFDNEIKIGTLGLYGFPTNKDYFRIINCVDINSNTQKTFWVKITDNRKAKILTSAWKEKIHSGMSETQTDRSY